MGGTSLETPNRASDATVSPARWADKLADHLARLGGAVIAYSGGVDSALLAYAARLALGDRMVAALADSPSLARREYRQALDFTRKHEIPLEIVRTGEMENPLYVANQGDRCYHCKRALFEKLSELRRQLEEGMSGTDWAICYGVNLDDLGDHRPGIQAGREASIQAPYVDIGIDKKTIRSICSHYQLDIADKPAMPCMSSRISYGQQVTEEKLSQVEQAEDVLYGIGLTVLRVRHHGDTARIEIPLEDVDLLFKHRDRVADALHDLGFIYVSLDLDGFKSGSLNAVLISE